MPFCLLPVNIKVMENEKFWQYPANTSLCVHGCEQIWSYAEVAHIYQAHTTMWPSAARCCVLERGISSHHWHAEGQGAQNSRDREEREGGKKLNQRDASLNGIGKQALNLDYVWSGQALDQAAQGGEWVPIPRGI